MKKILVGILILLLIFGGLLFYNFKKGNKIPRLEVQEQVINIDELYVYGTHLNLHGNIVDDQNLELVLYNGDFKVVNIKINDNNFTLADLVNEGLYLEDIPRGDYFLFIRSKHTDEKGNDSYKYYALKNNTTYKETTYYTFSNVNNKVIITSEDSYSTMMIKVSENTDKDIYDIVIDPGHGGMDGGASRYGYKESDFTLDLAIMVKEKLESIGMKVKLTHEKDQLSGNEKMPEYGVHGRVVVPYEVKAKYLFSLHFNSNGSASVNGLEVYTADNINYDFAKSIAKNITDLTGLNYSSNNIRKVFDGVYTRTFTESDIENSIKDYQEDGRNPYDITTKSNYYYIIRESGGIVTGAYVDDRNEEITGNPYVKSNVGTEAYLLELGYISNKNDLDNLINNMDKYATAIANSITPLYNKEK